MSNSVLLVVIIVLVVVLLVMVGVSQKSVKNIETKCGCNSNHKDKYKYREYNRKIDRYSNDYYENLNNLLNANPPPATSQSYVAPTVSSSTPVNPKPTLVQPTVTEYPNDLSQVPCELVKQFYEWLYQKENYNNYII